MSLVMPAPTRLNAWESGFATDNACKGAVERLSPGAFVRENTSPRIPIVGFMASPIAISCRGIGTLSAYGSADITNSPRTGSVTGMPRSGVTPSIIPPPPLTSTPRTADALTPDGIHTTSPRAGSANIPVAGRIDLTVLSKGAVSTGVSASKHFQLFPERINTSSPRGGTTTMPVAGRLDFTVVSKDGVSTGVSASRHFKHDPLEEQRNEQILPSLSPHQHQAGGSPASLTTPHKTDKVTRMLSAPSGNQSPQRMNTKDHNISRRISVSTTDASDDCGEQSPSDISFDATSESSCDERDSKSYRGDMEEKMRIDREIALDTTVAAIEAFMVWLDTSGQKLHATTKPTDLSSDVVSFFSRITHLVEIQMSPLPKEVASSYLWRMVLLGLRRERLHSVLATMFQRCNDLSGANKARNASMATMFQRCNDLDAAVRIEYVKDLMK